MAANLLQKCDLCCVRIHAGAPVTKVSYCRLVDTYDVATRPWDCTIYILINQAPHNVKMGEGQFTARDGTPLWRPEITSV